ncbi:MAG: phosphatidylserine decarboxylase [Porphyromonas sp.]|nr:phosphatidylserine decarboxylase [Bacteroidales bacterium]MDD7559089.1 phosphatidylserine decarboxylase [Bacteroidales bacterium]MDY3100480.1 phosphatidylserine decarboxylase [Porphyromonas sp.]
MAFQYRQSPQNTAEKRPRVGFGVIAGAFVLFGFTLLYLYFALDSKWAFWIILPPCVVLTAITINFFRIPKREYTGPRFDGREVLASADGRIVVIEEVYEPECLKRNCIMVSTFMSVTNVHANWIPIEGEVLGVAHHDGNFLKAYLPKASIENEHATVHIRTLTGDEIVVRQVAGALAQRIITWVKAGEKVSFDTLMGFILFGSRVDLFLPLGSEIKVSLDEPVRANQTLMAVLPGEKKGKEEEV